MSNRRLQDASIEQEKGLKKQILKFKNKSKREREEQEGEERGGRGGGRKKKRVKSDVSLTKTRREVKNKRQNYFYENKEEKKATWRTGKKLVYVLLSNGNRSF